MKKHILLSATIIFLYLTTPFIQIVSTQQVEINPFQQTPLTTSLTDIKLESIINMIDKELITEFVENIVQYSPRNTGSYGCEKTAQYIANEFEENNLQIHIQNWTRYNEKRIKTLFTSQNIEGILQGTSKDRSAIIFNAHYDAVKQSPGADDDASGVAAVLAAAYALSKFEFKHDIRFITFSGEEDGLLGSKSYVKEAYEKNDDILVALNADMIANTNTEEGEKKLRVYGSEDVLWILDIIENINEEYHFNYNLDIETIDEEGRMGSDYATFIRYGYEAIAFFEGEWNLNFHTPNDSIENINIDYLVNNTKIIAATLARVADTEDLPQQIMIESPAFGHLYYEGRKIKEIEEMQTTVINDIWIWAGTIHGTRPLEKVEFYYDDKLIFTDYEYPYKWHFNKISFKTHRIKAVAYDDLGRTTSDWKDISFFNLFRFN